jgi:hypothetical protein
MRHISLVKRLMPPCPIGECELGSESLEVYLMITRGIV